MASIVDPGSDERAPRNLLADPSYQVRVGPGWAKAQTRPATHRREPFPREVIRGTRRVRQNDTDPAPNHEPGDPAPRGRHGEREFLSHPRTSRPKEARNEGSPVQAVRSRRRRDAPRRPGDGRGPGRLQPEPARHGGPRGAPARRLHLQGDGARPRPRLRRHADEARRLGADAEDVAPDGRPGDGGHAVARPGRADPLARRMALHLPREREPGRGGRPSLSGPRTS
jgi:hypothetical protein